MIFILYVKECALFIDQKRQSEHDINKRFADLTSSAA